MRSAAKQGPQAKQVFSEIKKVGGKPFRDAVEEAYAKIKAFAAGTTDEPWDWMDYSMTVKFITSVQKGTRAWSGSRWAISSTFGSASIQPMIQQHVNNGLPKSTSCPQVEKPDGRRAHGPPVENGQRARAPG